MHNILDRLSFFPHMPFSLLFKSSRVSCYEGGTCFPYETPHRPKPAIFVENRNGRIQPSKHTNLKLIRVFIIIIILLFCTVLIWLGKFPCLIYFDFCPKKEIAPAFQRKKKTAMLRAIQNDPAAKHVFLHTYISEQTRKGEEGRESRTVSLIFVQLLHRQQFCAIRPLKSVRRLLCCSRNTKSAIHTSQLKKLSTKKRTPSVFQSQIQM